MRVIVRVYLIVYSFSSARPSCRCRCCKVSKSAVESSFDNAKLRTKKGRQKKSVAQWEFMGVFMGVLAISLSSWEFSKKSWEFLGV